MNYVTKVDSRGIKRKYVEGNCSICGKHHQVLSFTYIKNPTFRHKGCFSKMNNLNQHAIGVSRRTPESVSSSIYHSYLKSALRRNLVWDISLEEFRLLTKQDCVYCGVVPSQRHSLERNVGTSVYLYNGIDRKDNSKGYLLENCVPCCSLCNFAKRDMSSEQWSLYLNRLVTYQQHLRK